MHNVWLIIKREYLERIRSKWFVIFTIAMPALMAGSVLLPAKLAQIKSSNVRKLVLVTDNPAVADAVKQQLMEPPKPDKNAPMGEQEQPTNYQITIVTDTSDAEKDALRQQVSDGRVDGFVWLTDQALADRKITYSARDIADFSESGELRSAIRTAMVTRQLAAKGMSRDEVETLLQPIDLESVHIEKGKEGASGTAVFLTSFVMVMLLYANVLVYGFAVMRSIIEEKSSRILEVLLSCVTSKELLAGKIIGVGAVGLTQVFIWLIMAGLFSMPGVLAAKGAMGDIHIPMAAVVAFGVFFLLGYFLYSTMYAAVGAMVNSDQEAQQMQWPAMLPIVLSIVLSTPVLQHPNSTLSFWLSIIPFFAPILMFVRVMIEQPPAWQLALCIGLMLVTIYALLGLSSRIYRVGILMYGKRPTLSELRRWLKYAG